MMIEIGVGVVGKNDTSWGQAPDGSPVLLVRTPAATLRILFTADEAKEHGGAAIYLAYAAQLAAAPAPGAARQPSMLVGPDGGPIA